MGLTIYLVTYRLDDRRDENSVRTLKMKYWVSKGNLITYYLLKSQFKDLPLTSKVTTTSPIQFI
jgi:hypothetical protein